MPNEKWEPARVIDVRVREHDSINLDNRHGQLEVLCLALTPLTLKQAAVQDNGLARDTKNVTRACDLTRSTNEFDLHNCSKDSRPSVGVRARSSAALLFSAAVEEIQSNAEEIDSRQARSVSV